MNAAGTEYNCTDYNHFAGGDIITAGRFSPLEKIDREAIVGGTGNYAGMRGTFAVRWLGPATSRRHGRRSRFSRDLLPPDGASGRAGAPSGAASGSPATESWR